MATGAVLVGGKNRLLEGMRNAENIRSIVCNLSPTAEIINVYDVKAVEFNAASSATMHMNGSRVFNVPEGGAVRTVLIYSSANAGVNPVGMNHTEFYGSTENAKDIISITIDPREDFVTEGTFTLTSLQVNIVD